MWVEKNGPVYRIRDVVRGKKVTIQTGYPTKTMAKKAMVQFRAEQLQGTASPSAPGGAASSTNTG